MVDIPTNGTDFFKGCLKSGSDVDFLIRGNFEIKLMRMLNVIPEVKKKPLSSSNFFRACQMDVLENPFETRESHHMTPFYCLKISRQAPSGKNPHRPHPFILLYIIYSTSDG